MSKVRWDAHFKFLITSGHKGSTMEYTFAGFHSPMTALGFAKTLSETQYPCYIELTDGTRIVECSKGNIVGNKNEKMAVLIRLMPKMFD